MKDTQFSNSLSNETSPYLLQHANNPVHWHPWGPEALELARLNDKPILLSIGYSACHWCHVMAHESFENEQIATVMNEHFVNIKVDREERPDLDKIYQTAHQLLAQRSGGWPLTMFLTPDSQIPFYGGTYFPPEPRHGMPGFSDLLSRVAEFYQQEKDAILKQNATLMDAMDRIQTIAVSNQDELDTKPLDAAIDTLTANFDRRYGGFGSAPKFPHPSNLDFLLNYYCLNQDNGNQNCLDMVQFSLQQMARGGIYDHLGGGFCRYSVDQQWMIPHFEKMLYDNGQLLTLYAKTLQVNDDDFIKNIVQETADWIIRDMQSPSGGYYSSLDADSEGIEGKFYIWTPTEVMAILKADEFKVFSNYYGLDGPANFEGVWHLRIMISPDHLAEASATSENTATALLNASRDKLLQVRNKRIWPGRDEKILTSWNALTIKAMSVAAIRLSNNNYVDSAEKSLTFIFNHLWKDGRLLATSKDGKSHLNAYLDDYVFLLDAILSLLAARWDTRWLTFGIDLADVMLDQFYDSQQGGFFFTSHDHESLLQRRKDFMDDALPSGNGVAVSTLLHLGHLTGNQKYISAAEQTLRAAWQSITHTPHAHTTLLLALAEYCYPTRQIIIRGDNKTIIEWKNQCDEASGVRDVIYAIPDTEASLPGLLNDKKITADSPVAYVCEGFTCKAPIMTRENLISHLKPPSSR